MHHTGLTKEAEEFLNSWRTYDQKWVREDVTQVRQLEHKVSMLERKISKIKLRHVIKRDIANLLRPIYDRISALFRAIDK